MWVMTTRGFYSAVHKDGDPAGLLTVRARVKKDLENLKDLLPDAKPYQQSTWSDYPWRMKVPAADWARVMAVLALDIDYHNFKDEVKHKQGSARANVYMSVWSALLKLTPAGAKKSYGYGSSYGSGLYESEKDEAVKLREEENLSDEQIADRLEHGVTVGMVERFFKDEKDKADKRQLALAKMSGPKVTRKPKSPAKTKRAKRQSRKSQPKARKL